MARGAKATRSSPGNSKPKQRIKFSPNNFSFKQLIGLFTGALVWLVSRGLSPLRYSAEHAFKPHHLSMPQGLRECFIIFLLALGVFIFGALVTYEPLSTSVALYSGDNFAGPLGHELAAVLLRSVGVLAFAVPFACWGLGLRSFRVQAVVLDASILVLRALGLCLTLVCASGLIQLHAPIASWSGAWTGGNLGALSSALMVQALSPGGANVVLITGLLIGVNWAVGFSWLALLERLLQMSLQILQNTTALTRTLMLRISQAFKRAKPKGLLNPESIASAQGELVITGSRKNMVEPSASPMAIKGDVVDASIAAVEVFSAPVSGTKPASLLLKPKRKAIGVKPTGELPGLNLLDPIDTQIQPGYTHEDLTALSQVLEVKLKDFGIQAKVETVLPGPVVTRFEIQPAAGVKVSRITNLAKDLARSMAVMSVRVVEVIPGKTTVGIEIPNRHRELIRFSQVLASSEYEQSESALSLVLGKDIAGKSVVANLAKMPHVLVAGTTGSGKSVGLNAMILSILFKATPEEVRMIMIDPKMLELSVYDDIPHLLSPVVTDMKEAANALRWCVAEMERRYRLMAALGVRNLMGYNKKVQAAIDAGKPLADPLATPTPIHGMGMADAEDVLPTLKPLPYVVVVIDEFADMIMIVGKKVEELIARIAQKARAAGIHLILATQRPSVDVITGLIKANVPARIGFQVSSKVDSRTILDQGGAEQLLGHGDMLYLPPGTGLPVRVHGAFVSDEEVHRVCDDWRARSEPHYLEAILEGGSSESMSSGLPGMDDADAETDVLYDEAVKFVTQTRKVSISSVQRKLKIGYNRAARMVETMEGAGVVSSPGHNGGREVLAPPPVEV